MSDELPPPPPGAKPLFLAGSAGTSYPDAGEAAPPPPGKPLRPRHREVARLVAAGKRDVEIAKQLNYTPVRVCQIKQLPAVQAEIERIQEAAFSEDVQARMKDLGQDAVDVFEEVLRDPNLSASKKLDSAKWLLEKLTGKAKQEVSVQNQDLSAFMDMLRGMQRRGESIDAVDVTPTEVREVGKAEPEGLPQSGSGASDLEKWVDDNL